jgi:hypothetical protein
MPNKIPQVQTADKDFNLYQSQLQKAVQPALDNPQNAGMQLTNIVLSTGTNTINHMLGRPMQGWYLTDINGAATVYRSQPLNAQTLTLLSSAVVTVSLWVY